MCNLKIVGIFLPELSVFTNEFLHLYIHSWTVNRDLSVCWDKLTCESESLHMWFIYVALDFQGRIIQGEKIDLTEDWLKNILQAIILVPWEYINDTIMFRYYTSDGLELLI